MQRTTAARVDGSRTFLALPINDVSLAFAGMMDCCLTETNQVSRHRSSPQFIPPSAAGYLYYVRLKTSVGPLYKLGFTTRKSVYDRFALKGNGDETLLDEVYLFAHRDDAYAVEQQLHVHFADRNAFGAFASDPRMPLYQNGQSELYVDDILRLDPMFGPAQAERTRAALPPVRQAVQESSLHWSALVLITVVRSVFLALGFLLRFAELVIGALLRVDPEHRGGIFGTSAAQKAELAARSDREARRAQRAAHEVKLLLQWARQNRVSNHDGAPVGPTGRGSRSPMPSARAASRSGAPPANSTAQVADAGGDAVVAQKREPELQHVPDASLPVRELEPEVLSAWLAGLPADEDLLLDATALDGARSTCETYAAPAHTMALPEDWLWDGIFFDRPDWIEEAMAAGTSPDTCYDEDVCAVFVAVLLGRPAALRVLASYGATYPSARIGFPRFVPFIEPYAVCDLGEPADAAIDRGDTGMLRSLLSLQASTRQFYDGQAPVDRGWSYAVSNAKRGEETALREILRCRLGELQDGLGEGIEALVAGAVLLLRLLDNAGARPARIRRIDDLRPADGDPRVATAQNIFRVGFRFDRNVKLPRSCPRAQRARTAIADASLALVDEPLTLDFTRVPLSETAFVEITEVDHSDMQTKFGYMDVGLFAASSPEAMARFLGSRSDTHDMARFLAALFEGHQEAVQNSLACGIDTDVASWEPKNLQRNLDLNATSAFDSSGTRVERGSTGMFAEKDTYATY
jgi:hypothetical protein